MDTNINPFEFFKEELDIDDVCSRINTIHKVTIVATLMSTDSIKSTLIPYLDSLMKKEDDEVVYAIADQLANLAPLLGNQQTLVLSYLQNLCSHDETVVRERACKSIIKMLANLSDNEVNNFIIPLVMRLATNQVNFTCRVSATLLMPEVYPKAGHNKQKIRQKFTEISNEEMLMLQRATATKIAEMCHVYEKEYVLSDLIGILKHRSSDEQDQIRVLAIESFKSVTKILNRDENKTYIMPLIIQAADDKSWRVRLCLSKNFTEISENFGKEVTDMSLIQTYGNLLKDAEVDVKIEAVKSLSSFIKIVSPERMSVLIPQIVALGKDALSIVRSHVGGVIKNMVSSLSKDQAYQNIQPLIKQLMADDNQEVRKGGIQAAVKFIEVNGPETMNSLYPSFKTVSEDPKWRVRLELTNCIGDLSIRIQKNQEFFSKYLEPIFINYLKDRASGIREVAIEKIKGICKSYGNSWISTFIPKLQEVIYKDPSYHFKIAGICSLREIGRSVHGESNMQKVLNILFKSSNESVPNIREVTVKSLLMIASQGSKSTKEVIKKHLAGMTEDTDFQVRVTVNDALAHL